MQHSDSRGWRTLGFPRGPGAPRACLVWETSSSNSVLEFPTEFRNISCMIVLCFESAFAIAIKEVNRNSPVFYLGETIMTRKSLLSSGFRPEGVGLRPG